METCRRRFAADSHLSYHVNDGRSLAMIPDRSIDFVFSFDSMVHFPPDVLDAYLGQLPQKLKDNGMAFIHHSNLGEYRVPVVERLPGRARKLMTKAGILESDHQRDPIMTAELFRASCSNHGLACICQEIVNWRGRRLIDCFSTITHAGSKWERPARVFRNPNFMREAQLIRRRSAFYPATATEIALFATSLVCHIGP